MESYYDVHGIVKFKLVTNNPKIKKWIDREYFLFKGGKIKNLDFEVIIKKNIPWEKKCYAFDESYINREATEFITKIDFGVPLKQKHFTLKINNLLGKKTVIETECYDPNTIQHSIIETILRYKLRLKNCTMVHSACIAKNGKAYLLPAFGNTGKTTAVLGLVPKFDFFSDDLTIVSSDGYAYSFPRRLHFYYTDMGRYVKNLKQTRKKKLWLEILKTSQKILPRKLKQLISQTINFGSVPTLVQHIGIDEFIPEVGYGKKARLSKVVQLTKTSSEKITIKNANFKELALKSAYQTDIELRPLDNFWKDVAIHDYVKNRLDRYFEKDVKILESAFKNKKCYELKLPMKYDLKDFINNLLRVIP